MKIKELFKKLIALVCIVTISFSGVVQTTPALADSEKVLQVESDPFAPVYDLLTEQEIVEDENAEDEIAENMQEIAGDEQESEDDILWENEETQAEENNGLAGLIQQNNVYSNHVIGEIETRT